MQTFPVSSSHLSAHHLAKYLSKSYPFLENCACIFIKPGINDTYLLSSKKEKYIFRVYSYNWHSKLEIEEELRFLNLLKDKAVSVSFPILDKNKEYIQTFTAPEGTRYGVLFSFAKGEKRPVIAPTLHFKIGAMMGRLHTVSKNLELRRIVYNEYHLINLPYQRIQSFLPDEAIEATWLTTIKTRLIKEFAKFDHTQLRKGVIHLDIWQDNLVIDQAENISLFDFDFCGNGWLCIDLAYYQLQLYLIEKDKKIRTQKWNSFLTGYESVVEISSEEKRILPFLGVALYFFYLGNMCYRYENWSNFFLTESYVKQYVERRIKWYFEKVGIEKKTV